MSSVIAIRVTPCSAKPGIGEWRIGSNDREELQVKVAEPPAGGLANEAAVRMLAKALKVSRSEVTIISGAASRNKRIAVPLSQYEVRERLEQQRKGTRDV